MRLMLLHEISQFLTLLAETQQNLLALFEIKRQALDSFQPQELMTLSAREEELGARLQSLVHERSGLLRKARDEGFTVTSLMELSGAIEKTVDDVRVLKAIELIRARIVQSQKRTVMLQHESWVHWIIAHRCYNHFTELVDLIAHGGRPAPTYGDKPTSATGGALLDAAA